jgi:DNA invertase Pin-like site-specific DNA recombinase
MLVGYARTSTVDQQAGYDAQLRDLKAAGVEKVFGEQVSSVDVAARDQLAAALDYVREGDKLLVTKLDRLARSVAHLLDIVAVLERKSVGLKILAMDIDTSTPTGRLLLTMLGAVAEFERAIMLERQREGVAKARAAGKYRGRVPTARRQAGEVRRLRAEGVGAAEIARRLGIGRASVYRVLAEER